ncbi:MAG: hypothetical protein ABUL60_18405, partial [Myxococcales bacterium]
MRLPAFGPRRFLVLGLAAAAVLGCSGSEPGSPEPTGGGAGGGVSNTAGMAPGGSASGSAGANAATGGASGTGGTTVGGSSAEGGSTSTGGTAVGGGSSGSGGSNSAGTSSSGGGSGGSAGSTGSVPIDPALRQKCTGTNPIVCHLDAPDGNWDVTVDLGSDTSAGNSRVAAETRHYFGDARATAAGAHEL